MSSAMNHRKRSHRSEQFKNAAFRASSTRAAYRETTERRNRSILGRIASLFHRKIPKLFIPKEVEEE